MSQPGDSPKLPQHEVRITLGPPEGYHEAGAGELLLVCDRCGALVAAPGLHDRWHWLETIKL